MSLHRQSSTAQMQEHRSAALRQCCAHNEPPVHRPRMVSARDSLRGGAAGIGGRGSGRKRCKSTYEELHEI